MELTLKNYIKLIKENKKNFKFVKFGKFSLNESIVILRHDIDMSPKWAYLMAKEENKIDVKSTYFVQISSKFYNFFDPDICKLIKKIYNLGHDIGLHFDLESCQIKSIKNIEKRILLEKNILENSLGIKISLLTIHNPSELTNKIFKDIDFAGMHNCSSPYYFEEFSYCSDSNGIWRFKSIDQVFNDKNNKKIYFMTHPVWWQDKILPPRLKVVSCLKDNEVRIMKSYDNILKKSGRPNVKN